MRVIRTWCSEITTAAFKPRSIDMVPLSRYRGYRGYIGIMEKKMETTI